MLEFDCDGAKVTRERRKIEKKPLCVCKCLSVFKLYGTAIRNYDLLGVMSKS